MTKQIPVCDSTGLELERRRGPTMSFDEEIARLLRLEDRIKEAIQTFEAWLAVVRKEL